MPAEYGTLRKVEEPQSTSGPSFEDASRLPTRTDDDTALLAALPAHERRRLGCFWTPDPVARLMAELARETLEAGRHLLDPATGTGRLLRAVVEGFPEGPTRKRVAGRIHGVELRPDLAAWANRTLAALTGNDRRACHVADALHLLRAERRGQVLGRRHFGVVLANPPYVREKNHRQVFRALLSAEPAWRTLFNPRQDLQQLFLILGLELLEPGGELIYLVNPYWLHSDSGQTCRELLSKKARVQGLVDFGDVKLFPDAPGQHGLLLHARDRRGEAEPSPARFVRVRFMPAKGLEALCRSLALTLKGSDPAPWLELTEAPELVTSGPRRRWYVPHEADRQLALMERGGIPLGQLFETHQGVVSGADRVTGRNRAAVPPEVPLNAGIFVLSPEEVADLALSETELDLLKPLYRARDIRPFEVARGTEYILYLHRDTDLSAYPNVARHLRRFRALLSRRRECRLGKIPWYGLHWPRDPRLFERPRIVTPRRAKTPRFAMGRRGCCEQSDIAIITDPDDNEVRLRALLVILNSQPVALWCRHRGKHKGSIREFFGRALEEVPIPRARIDDPPAFEQLAAHTRPQRVDEGSRAVEALFALGQPHSRRAVQLSLFDESEEP